MEKKNNGKVFAIIGLVLGILSIVFSFWYMVNICAVVAGVAGIVLSVVGKNQLTAAGQAKGLAVAGLIVSIIGTVLSVIGLFTCTICVACVASSVDANDLNSLANELSAIANY